MALSAVKIWGNEILTFSDLNAEFANIYSNGSSLAWPATSAKDLDGQELILDVDGDTSITADTDDQIDVRIGGSDVLVITAASILFNGQRLATGSDVKVVSSLLFRVSTLEARVNQSESDGVLESQIYR